MNAWDELVDRCARRRAEKIGPLSDEAFAELMLAVRERPMDFVDDVSEQAFVVLARALDAYSASHENDDLLDDDAYDVERRRRLGSLRAECARAAALDSRCLDARCIDLLAAEPNPDELLAGLLALEQEFSADGALPDGEAWSNVFCRPRLRLRAALARTCLDGARYRMAAAAATSVLKASPADPLGARHTKMLALARLEDEAELGKLEADYTERESAWSHLARMLLLYKLDRMPAARRALRGFDGLCAGGAYALLRPAYVEPYLPDRPDVAPCGLEESVMAVREAEPIIVDVPEFIHWCESFDWLLASAQDFAEQNGLDW